MQRLSDAIPRLQAALTPGRIVALYLVVCVLALAVSILSGSRHDYDFYLLHWQNILAGNDPWAAEYLGNWMPPNAYGPVHTLLAGPAAIDLIVPKIIFCAVTLLAPLLFLRAPLPAERKPQALFLATVLYVCSPLVAITIFIFGINDGVVGFLILCACLFRSRRQHGWVGVMLGLAALLKFYPLLFAPLFAVTRSGTVHIKGILTAALTFAGGMAAAWLYWGNAVFRPFLFGSDRDPKLLSILRFLDDVKDSLSIAGPVNFLIDQNSLLVLIVATAVPLWGWLTRQGWEVTCLMGVLFIFLTYKVGHPQFYVAWIALQVWILATSQDDKARTLAAACLPVAVFLSLYQILYLLSAAPTGEYFRNEWMVFRQYGSVVLYALVAGCLLQGRRALRRTKGAALRIAL